MTQTTLYWFRQDLRLQDNPALVAAANSGQVLPVYILDDENAARWRMGGASRWWLHQSLTALDESLGGKLWVFCGDPKHISLSSLQSMTSAPCIGTDAMNRGV